MNKVLHEKAYSLFHRPFPSFILHENALRFFSTPLSQIASPIKIQSFSDKLKMDVLFRVKYDNPVPIFTRHSIIQKPHFSNSLKFSPFSFDHFSPFYFKPKFDINGYYNYNHYNYKNINNTSFVVKAMGKKNSDSSSSGSDRSNPGGNSRKGNNPSDANKSGINPSDSDKSGNNPSQKPHHLTQDWREFRAALFAREQDESTDTTICGPDGLNKESKPLGLKWAHPISTPEMGSVLVATEKLDGVCTFERTVVLLLRSGTRHPQEGPFGVIINRPLHKKIKHMKPNNLELAATFADCSLHFGGPLEASMFLLKTGEKPKLLGFEEVIPGLSFGARNSLDEAMGLVKKGVVKPQDFRFFVGYAGWQFDQLHEEIASNYWHVAACSSDLVSCNSSDSSEGLWEEILQLMGGQYLELSRKPKQDQ